MSRSKSRLALILGCAVLLGPVCLVRAGEEGWAPPELPGPEKVVTDRSELFLKGPEHIHPDVEIAKVAPTVDFMYYPGQTYYAEWSGWGDNTMADGKYYSSIGDHGFGPVNSYIHEYDPATKRLREVVDVSKLLNLPKGHYTPGKIHGRIDLAKDGWLYFATYHGMNEATSDKYHYKGDWIIRYHPQREKSEIVSHGPVGKRTIYGSIVDPERMIFYGIAFAGANLPKPRAEILFFAYDLQTRKVLYSAPMSNTNDLILADSTGRVYYPDPDEADRKLHRYDPATGQDVKLAVDVGNLFAATKETADGFVYTVSADGMLYSFNTKTEEVENLGSALVGEGSYIVNLDVDPTGRYLYYVPRRDGTPIVQFDLKTRKKKILAFLSPFYRDKYGFTIVSTFGGAVDPSGKTLYITWHGNNQGARYGYEACALTAIHLPQSATVSVPQETYEGKSRINASRYLGLIKRGMGDILSNMPTITASAEKAAKYLLDGGQIWVADRQGGFDMEARCRAGGLMSLLRTPEEGSPRGGDVVVYAAPGILNEEDIDRIKLWTSAGVYVVVFASGAAGEKAEAERWAERWAKRWDLIENYQTGLTVRNEGQEKLIPTDTVLNVINLWVWTGEFVSACTRAGKMPTMYLSYSFDQGKEREKKYLGKAFHDDFQIEPIEAGVLGKAYLEVIGAAVDSFTGEQMGDILRAAEWWKETDAANVCVVHMGHMFPEHLQDPRAPMRFGRSSWGDFKKDVPQELYAKQVVLILSYQRAPVGALNPAKETGMKLIYNSSTPGDPPEPVENVIYLEPGWPLPDATVDVPGYDVDILPGSGVMNAITYWTILAQVCAPLD